ncbi:flavin-containing monooxygenase [Actinomadura sp. HBU206391]|uniref:flavin-containing monooxygenase n=1 Tax=Actinomadura sp. HBU206391 TaxID=2731692 RepID=UPI00164FD0D5|nr:NAD(P)/FAD-dependent oxidoreductase [Actinomadura sp. HBU206391]MBC6460394.1 NAD(P)/FAD-dependent oxidoreductase [Actinomadura sp. HBU206391]
MSSPHGVVIIGAGFGGIGMAIRLKQEGVHDLVVLEKADEVGGTWRDNTYPGAACDVPSHLYSFSFAPKSDWTRRFPAQQEILRYLRDCADAHRVTPHIRFGSEVLEAVFDEDAGVWRIRTTAGELSARVLISACGQLSRPSMPAIEGLGTFAGKGFHSARWDHDYDLTGKRVAVIGTGASAIQFVPPVAERAGRMHVFQRSAPYVIDKPDRPYAEWERALLRRVPALQALHRAKIYLSYESRIAAFVKYPQLMDRAAKVTLRRLAEQVADRDLRRALIPDYPMGCKRILLSGDYYRALTRPGVELVTDPIERITPTGVVTRDGKERTVDAIIYGTGFDAGAFLAPMRITGRDGLELNEAWREGAQAYLGITVSGFPNLFLLYGPNTNLGGNSVIFMLESQIRYILGCVAAIRRHGLAWIDVRPEVQRAFVEDVQERMRATVWNRGCSSWYTDERGRHVANWPGFTVAYRRATRRPDPRDFQVRTA